MEKFQVRIHQHGPIITIHVVDSEGTIDVGVAEDLDDAIAKAVTKMYARKLAKHPAVELLEELVETADVDKVYDKAEKLVKELV